MRARYRSNSLASLPKGLDCYTPEDRHKAYKVLRLKVTAHPDGGMETKGGFNYDSAPVLCTAEAACSC